MLRKSLLNNFGSLIIAVIEEQLTLLAEIIAGIKSRKVVNFITSTTFTLKEILKWVVLIFLLLLKVIFSEWNWCHHGDIILNRSSNLKISIKTFVFRISASRWFYYKTQLWNFKYYRVQIEKVSYWLTSKQSMSNHVSLCQDMRFLFAFPLQLVNLRYSIEFGLRDWKR